MGICVNCHVENYGYYCAATKNSKFEYMKFHLSRVTFKNKY